MPDGRIVVIGASAGGVEALLAIVPDIPPGFPAPLFVVVHIPAGTPSALPDLLSRRGNLPSRHASDGEPYEPGTIYVAPPDHHLLLDDGRMRVVRGPRENRHRPAIDPLFRSAALVAGPKVIGVILSGSLDDGTAGLLAIKKRGGIAVVQDPADAMHASMPQSALDNVEVDAAVPLRQIAGTLVHLLQQQPIPMPIPANDLDLMTMETQIAGMDQETLQNDARPGTPSGFSCPDCGGVLWEVRDGRYTRYRCRVGHAYSPETIDSAQNELLEEAFWAALHTLEERATLSRRLADTERKRGHPWMAARFDERERKARQQAGVIRRLVESGDSDVPQVTSAKVQVTRRRRR